MTLSAVSSCVPWLRLKLPWVTTVKISRTQYIIRIRPNPKQMSTSYPALLFHSPRASVSYSFQPLRQLLVRFNIQRIIHFDTFLVPASFTVLLNRHKHHDSGTESSLPSYPDGFVVLCFSLAWVPPRSSPVIVENSVVFDGYLQVSAPSWVVKKRLPNHSKQDLSSKTRTQKNFTTNWVSEENWPLFFAFSRF